MKFRHSGKLGDAVYSLAAVRAFERSDYYVNLGGGHLGHEGAQLLLPLLRAQRYIGEAEVWTGQPFDHDFDRFREMNVCYLNLAACHLMTIGLSYELLSLPWLTVPNKAVLPGSGVVFARSAAHRGAPGVMEVLYSHFGQGALFVGTEAEWQGFGQECGPISYAPTADLLELAQVIAGCKLFIGNQSSPLAIAEGLKVPTVHEVHAVTPNCVFYREGAYAAWAPGQVPGIAQSLGRRLGIR